MHRTDPDFAEAESKMERIEVLGSSTGVANADGIIMKTVDSTNDERTQIICARVAKSSEQCSTMELVIGRNLVIQIYLDCMDGCKLTIHTTLNATVIEGNRD